MRLRGVIEEDFSNYKIPSLFLGTCFCDFKCCHEAGLPITLCQNEPLTKADIIDLPASTLLCRYIRNPITQAIVIGGMEPMMQFQEICELIETFRYGGINDDIVLYTGYNNDEITDQLDYLSQFGNIVVKFGRYVPNNKPHYDNVLGVNLASDNQYAVRL